MCIKNNQGWTPLFTVAARPKAQQWESHAGTPPPASPAAPPARPSAGDASPQRCFSRALRSPRRQTQPRGARTLTVVAKMLLDAGAPATDVDSLGFSVLHRAARAGHDPVVEMLLKAPPPPSLLLPLPMSLLYTPSVDDS